MAALLSLGVSPQSAPCLHLSCSTDGAEQEESAALCKYFQYWLVSMIWCEFWFHTHVRLCMYIVVFLLLRRGQLIAQYF